MKLRFPRRIAHSESPPRLETSEYIARPLRPGTCLGDYELGEVLSSSGSGYAYTANSNTALVQEYFPTEIAVRDIDGVSVLLYDETVDTKYEYGLSRFLLLARILSQIDHPGRVVHYQQQHDTAWYAVNIETRATMADLLSTDKRLPEQALESILYVTLTYLAGAHENGIFHLELGPSKLVLSGEDELTVCGFNVATLGNPAIVNSETSSYFAPEHLHTSGRLGPWTDFYALGALLYQGVSRKAPIAAAERETALKEGASDPLVSALKLGEGLYSVSFLELVDWLLAMSTGDRPKNVEQIFQRLDPNARVTDEEESNQGVPLFAFGSSSQTDELPTGSEDNDSNNKQITNSSPAGIAIAALQPFADTMIRGTTTPNRPTASTQSTFANELEQAAKILEPTSLHQQWRGDLNVGSLVSPHSRAYKNQRGPVSRSTPTDASRWKMLLRPRISSQATRASIYPTESQADDSSLLTGSSGLPLTARDHVAIRWPANNVVWLSLAFVILASGIWLWQRTELPVTSEPVRLEIIGQKDLDNLVNQDSVELVTTGPEARLDPPNPLDNSPDSDQISTLLTSATQYLSNGTFFGATNENAYAAYRAVLDLDPTNVAASNEIDRLISIAVAKVSLYLDNGETDNADTLLVQLVERELAQEKTPTLRQRLQVLENLHRQQELSRELAADQLQQEQQIRRVKINSLLNRASNAFENGKLIRPQGDNALTLYRAALDLERNNQRARNGINSIGDHFVQQARMALSTGDLDHAEQYLQNATIIRKNDQTIARLQQQLKQRRELVQREQQLQAELAIKQAEAKRLATEQAWLNLKSGIEAYYHGNYFEAYSFLRPLAGNGVARAQVRVASMLLYGRGVTPNNSGARKWFTVALAPVQLAAARGEAWAQSDYGDYFSDGFVIQQDFRQAIIWYRRAADQGYPPAQANLGLMHMHGSGVLPDWNEAIGWFRLAAAQGNYTARENLRMLEVQPTDVGS